MFRNREARILGYVVSVAIGVATALHSPVVLASSLAACASGACDCDERFPVDCPTE